MTEQEWAACAQVADLLGYLRGRASARKYRLFAVACCRRLWGRFHDPRTRHLIEVAERYADGEAAEAELRAALRANEATDASPLRWAAANAAEGADAEHALRAAFWAGHALAASAFGLQTYREEGAAQCRLVREVFGNPFRPPPVLDPGWLSWREGIITTLARTIYEARLFVELPVLAVALQEAGCADEGLLGHLREPEGHVRGCWALDLLLGKS